MQFFAYNLSVKHFSPTSCGAIRNQRSKIRRSNITSTACRVLVYKIPYRRARAWPLGRVRRASKGILHTSRVPFLKNLECRVIKHARERNRRKSYRSIFAIRSSAVKNLCCSRFSGRRTSGSICIQDTLSSRALGLAAVQPLGRTGILHTKAASSLSCRG